MNCHQPRPYFKVMSHRQTSQPYSGMGRGTPIHNYNYQQQPEPDNVHSNKRPRYGSNGNNFGTGRVNNSTLPAWMTRQSISTHFNQQSPHTLHTLHNSHTPHLSFTSDTQHYGPSLPNNQHGSLYYHTPHISSANNTSHTPHNLSANNNPHSSSNNDNPWSFVAHAVVFVNSELRKMPITSNNNLPHLSLQLGKDNEGPALSVVYDTAAAITSGYLPHHMMIQQKCPEIVHSFEEFDGEKPFDPIKLMGTISNISDYDACKHGMLSAVIRYFTPYQDSNGNRILLPVALGDSMSVDTIWGNTVINEWQLVLEFNPPIAQSVILR